MKKLVIVWKSDNDIDINKFILPYAYNSKLSNWFDEVEILIWGKSQVKVKDDQEIHKTIKKLLDEGVKIFACKMCADSVGATEVLEPLGVTVMYTGVYLSDNQKDSNVEVITI